MAKEKTEDPKGPTTGNKQVDEEKPVWHTAEKVVVKSVKLVRNPMEQHLLKAVKFEASDGKIINYYPQNTELSTGLVGDFPTDLTTKKPYLITEFIANAPGLVVLAKAIIQKGPQEIRVSYMESKFKGVLYNKIFKGQFDLMYYAGYDKDESKIDKMLSNKAKYEMNIEMPLDE